MDANEHRGRVTVEPAQKRVRVMVGGVIVADTTDALYVWEVPYYPQYYFPLADVGPGVLKETATTRQSPSRGTASYFSVQGGDRVVDDGAWCYRDSPIDSLRDRVRFDWPAMDAWFEEDEEVFVHPRDPHTRVDILRSSRSVRVAVGGVVVAETTHPTFLFETGLGRRTYIPKIDVRMDLLEPTASQSACPYKGTARWWSVRAGGELHTDLAWSYDTPLRESAPIAGLVAFYDERVDVTLDGARQPRPTTKFS
ncbi:MAG TPA: DUF427 domain-containing protein [Acidimicrobiia bacterium]|nr:DUF427 domain-containing protein [Acidimicrobiia bacterium]